MNDFQSRFNELAETFLGNDTYLAQTLGVTKQAVSAWRNGTRSPRKDTIVEIAKKFNVSVEWLMGFDVPKTKNYNIDAHIDYAPQNLTTADVKAVAQYILEQTPDNKAPRTTEARIVSFGMDNLPKENRELILGMIRGMFAGKPEAKLFEDKEGKNDDA